MLKKLPPEFTPVGIGEPVTNTGVLLLVLGVANIILQLTSAEKSVVRSIAGGIADFYGRHVDWCITNAEAKDCFHRTVQHA